MRILLVSPEFPQTYWGAEHALKLVGKKAAFPPLGLMTLPGLFPSSWEKRLVDLNVVAKLKKSDLEWADQVFVTGMLIQKKAIHRVLKQGKAAGKITVLGGTYATTTEDEIPDADHIFIGEAEETLPEYVRDLAAGKTRRIYEAAEKPDLTTSPNPDYSLIDMRKYAHMSLQYSRGCPFACEFCDIIVMYGRKSRTKTPEQVKEGLDSLYRLGHRGSVFIVDDNFIGNIRNVKALMPHLIEWQERHNFPFSFFTEASVNLGQHPSLLEQMKAAGFDRVFMGIESPDEASLKETGKTQNTHVDLLEVIQQIQGYGIEVRAGFIVGFDNDGPGVFDAQAEFIQKSGIPLAMVGMLNALPLTPLWKRLNEAGRLVTDSNGNLDGMNFIPTMGVEQLREGYRALLKRIYDAPAFYQRVLINLNRMPPLERATPNDRNLLINLLVFGRIVWTLGLWDSSRSHFWRLLWELPRERRTRTRFGQAMAHAAMGYHFRRVMLSEK